AMRRIQFRSAPAENDLPAPESTTTRMPFSASMERSASVSSAISASSNALCRSGRFMVTSPIGPWRSMASEVMEVSHPEHAEPRVLDGRVEGRREAQGEHAARVHRIDHAVVPEAGGGVVGMALALVLLADRRLEGLFLGGRPLPALRLDAVALHRGEDRGRLLAAHHRDARVGPAPQEARVEGAAAHA